MVLHPVDPTRQGAPPTAESNCNMNGAIAERYSASGTQIQWISDNHLTLSSVNRTYLNETFVDPTGRTPNEMSYNFLTHPQFSQVPNLL
jgi:hypothetical protein